MVIVFLSNYVNHHQVPLADVFYGMPNVSYTFIATQEMYDWRKQLGYPDFSDRPYVLNSFESKEKYDEAISLINDADVLIVGSAPESMIVQRLKRDKLTFRYSERWFKKRKWYMLGLRGLYNIYMNHYRYRNKNLYMLAASAYTANDVSHFFLYPNKIFKWGYFPRVDTNDMYLIRRNNNLNREKVSLMWCSRFIDWKHPEMPIKIAKRLKDEGYDFILNMYGNGEKLEEMRSLASMLLVEDVVAFHGSKPNEEIIHLMQEHDIFLFTSDKNEGWGAVLNESMSCGCAVVVSDMIGAAPFLIENNKNGLLFKSGNVESLYAQVKRLFDDEVLRTTISDNAIYTMKNVWNPVVAAERLVHLANRLLHNMDTDYIDGPCSKA